MNEIVIPYHLVVPTLISLIAIMIIISKRKILFSTNKRKRIWISISVFCVVYTLIVGIAMLNDISCQLELNRFDLNNDGIFSGTEITKEQGKAMSRLINDTGRNFSFITGLIFSLIISTPFYWIVLFFEKLKGKHNNYTQHTV